MNPTKLQAGARPTTANVPGLCPQSITGIHDEGSRRDGHCTWCGRRFTGKAPRPRLVPGQSALQEAYDNAYDPDWGGGR